MNYVEQYPTIYKSEKNVKRFEYCIKQQQIYRNSCHLFCQFYILTSLWKDSPLSSLLFYGNCSWLFMRHKHSIENSLK